MITITYELFDGVGVPALTYEKGGGHFLLGKLMPCVGEPDRWRLYSNPRLCERAGDCGVYQEPPFTDLLLVLTYLCQVHGFKSYKLEVKIPGLK